MLQRVAFGAEALLYHVEEEANSNGWFLAKNFKAHLYPEGTAAQQNPRVSALPFGVSLRQVYTDFLGYLLKHTKSYFEERIIDGAEIWERYQPTMEIVMSHPHGWSVREQSFLQDTVVRAGYTTSDLAPTNIRFINELEASAYCCISYASLTTKIQTEDTFILCDAGVTATNISLHKVGSTNPILQVDTRNLEHLEGGATSIDAAAERYMRQKMINAGISPEDVNDFTRAGIEDFKKHIKFAFSDETKEYLIQIANTRFNDPTLGARRGRMALPGSVVKSFFTEYVDTIRHAIDWRVAEAGVDISHILLVGRFGDSSYLRRVIKELYEPRGYQIALAANSTSRAVVDGALIWNVGMNNGYRTAPVGWDRDLLWELVRDRNQGGIDPCRN
ncbi:hypothetical protein OPQ81_011641 [Rhizoctonia solani]|nr:hypothetical protein OPQ81_011641 [Rhizoctonia solani]